MVQIKNNILGNKYGKLLVKKYLKYSNWECLCDCGTICTRKYKNLLNESVAEKSCGCTYQDAGGLSNTRLYWRFKTIKERCYKSYSKYFYNYGGRGIKVWEPWKNNFKAFRQYLIETFPEIDIDNIPTSLEIDRIDNDKNYEPGNIRLVTSQDNNNNRRDNNRFLIFGEELTSREIHKFYGLTISKNSLDSRLRKGYDVYYSAFAPRAELCGKMLPTQEFSWKEILDFV